MSTTASVTNGILEQTEAISSTNVRKTGTSELGKDAFLQLLVCQMKNQDPLNPSSDTEFVSQLATFSQLEQLQNLTASSDKSQAFSLVGKDVIVQNTDSSGNKTEVSGTVDFISMSGSKIYLSIENNLYSLDDLVSVIDTSYLVQKGSPTITNTQKLEYDAQVPSDLTFDVSLGEGDYVASEIAVVINGNILDSSLISLNGTKVTISKDAMAKMSNGTYGVTVVFNDPNYTTVSDKVSLTVSNSKAVEGSDDTDGTNETEDSKEETIDAIA
ncbi:flagellar hook capping FlgD N-terminal domain-containing protein [Clostridium sp. Marseille-P299]|uniref:flagellar hook capping FlgD N-terminal domain-containing protein n=1 Tax=Clostridium sp. Marseille-P299 TaxID=1805477 RepID=UPI00082A4703|nr:flagellar hook capping FlgD N-terminal domain-containing protein [Clostridium sp. Marseille-P299]